MKNRCHNPNDSGYLRYGGRGIFVCDEWRTDFQRFRSDMGPKPDGMSLERKNNSLGYYPYNCIWGTRHQQSRNKRSNTWITHNGETLCITDWARKLGVRLGMIQKRIRLGWSTERILSTPRDGFRYGQELVPGAHYRGVSKKRKKFRARFGKAFLGTFKTQEEAALAVYNYGK